MIPYSRQSISKKDIQSVLKVLKSSWLTQGPAIPAFEQALAKYCGARYAVALSSGTAALHLACLAMGVQKGDEVITSPNSFAATANCILYAGGRPVFCDVEPEQWNLDPSKLEKHLSRKIKGIIPVHFAGHPCDMESIAKIARKKKLFVLEDACHALGGEYRIGKKKYRAGSCSHSDAAILSFHPVKSIATGEGGAVLTNRKDIYKKILAFRTHGITKDAGKFINKEEAFWNDGGKLRPAGWYYEMQELGFNYRFTDLQSALGMSQLKRLPEFMAKRQAIARIYNKAFLDFPGLRTPLQAPGVKSACHLYVIQLELEKLKAGRAEIFDALRRQGLGVQVHYIPIHYQPYYRGLGFKKGSLPVCEDYYRRAISIPIFPAMTRAEIKTVIQTVKKVLTDYLK